MMWRKLDEYFDAALKGAVSGAVFVIILRIMDANVVINMGVAN